MILKCIKKLGPNYSLDTLCSCQEPPYFGRFQRILKNLMKKIQFARYTICTTTIQFTEFKKYLKKCFLLSP